MVEDEESHDEVRRSADLGAREVARVRDMDAATALVDSEFVACRGELGKGALGEVNRNDGLAVPQQRQCKAPEARSNLDHAVVRLHSQRVGQARDQLLGVVIVRARPQMIVRSRLVEAPLSIEMRRIDAHDRETSLRPESAPDRWSSFDQIATSRSISLGRS